MQPQAPPNTAKMGWTTAIVNARLFLSSYAPLFALLALRFEDCSLRFGCLGLALVGTVDLYAILFQARHIEPVAFSIVEVVDRGAEVAGYMVAYLLPFLVVTAPSWTDVAAYSLFLIITGLIYVRSDMIHINPLLYVVGYRVLQLTTDGGDYLLISRRAPQVGTEIAAVRVRGRLLLWFGGRP